MKTKKYDPKKVKSITVRFNTEFENERKAWEAFCSLKNASSYIRKCLLNYYEKEQIMKQMEYVGTKNMEEMISIAKTRWVNED